MKNRFLTFFLFLIMIILITGITILGVAIYLDICEDDTSPEVFKLDGIVTEIVSEREKENTQAIDLEIIGNLQNTNSTENVQSLSLNSNQNEFYFYNQLNDTAKAIYDGLYSNKANLKQGDFVIKYGNKFSNVLSKENGSTELGDDYQTAVEAFTHDNPDLFYLDVNKMYLNIETTTKLLKTTYNVYIAPSNGSKYWIDGFQTQEEVDDGIAKIEMVKNEILKRLTGTNYQKILYIHDYLVGTIDYDSNYSSLGTYNIYGALLERKCVCEGYAKAFKYLANAAGFKCEIMQGLATNSSGQTENHAWNCIELNGVWYEIDSTWDDPIIIGNGKATSSMKYKYFLKGRDTFKKDHELSYKFSSEGKEFSYPEISDKDY